MNWLGHHLHVDAPSPNATDFHKTKGRSWELASCGRTPILKALAMECSTEGYMVRVSSKTADTYSKAINSQKLHINI